MNRYSIFDFCSTIVNYETADDFVLFCCDCLKIKHSRFIGSIKHFFSDVIGHFTHESFYKKSILKLLKGTNKETINQLGFLYYKEKIKNRLNLQVIQKLEDDRKNGYVISLCSAAYMPYLQPFLDEYNIQIYCANSFLYDNGVFTGKITSRDCSSRNKLKMIKQYISVIEMKESIAYSDSKSDLPLLKAVGKGVVVSKKKKKWPQKNGLEELIIE